jgi:regulator of sigma E protease
MQRIVRASAGKKLAIVVERAGQQLTLTAIPTETMDKFCYRTVALGIGRRGAEPEPVGPGRAVALAIQQCGLIVEATLSYIGRVASAQESGDQIGGPVAIARASSQAARMGLAEILYLSAVLSISIGLLNLFPVPLLDGGHLLFYGIEAVRRKPLSEQTQEYGFRAGLFAVLALMLFATYNDICRLPWPDWARGPLNSVCPVCVS